MINFALKNNEIYSILKNTICWAFSFNFIKWIKIKNLFKINDYWLLMKRKAFLIILLLFYIWKFTFPKNSLLIKSLFFALLIDINNKNKIKINFYFIW